MWARLVRRALEPLHLRLEFEAVAGGDDDARAWRIDQIAGALEPGDRLEVTILLHHNHDHRRTDMDEERLTAVLDRAAGDNPHALVEDLRTGELSDRPEVRKAIAADAKLRNKDEEYIRTKVAVPYLEGKFPRSQGSPSSRNWPPAPPPDSRSGEPPRAQGDGEGEQNK